MYKLVGAIKYPADELKTEPFKAIFQLPLVAVNPYLKGVFMVNVGLLIPLEFCGCPMLLSQ